MSDKPARAPQARTFVVRLVIDEQAAVHGQASEPGSADDWRVAAASLAELWDRLERRIASAPRVDGAPDGPGEES